MKAIDTNILARYIVRDDAGQTPKADTLIASGCFVSSTVLLETAWLLSSRYRLSRSVIADVLAGIVELPQVACEDRQLVGWAIRRFGAGADFADMMHLLAARNATEFVTFDRRLARQAGPGVPVPIELPA